MGEHWWSDMNLDLWARSDNTLASTARDMPFAQAVAERRAQVRGVRQRIYLTTPRHTGGRVLLHVADTHRPLAEPCS